MTVNTNKIREIMEHIGFPQEAVIAIGESIERLSESADFNSVADEFIAHPENIDDILKRLGLLSKQLGENGYTMNMCLLLCACPALRERYAERGIDEEIFWKSIEDLRWKLRECMDCKGVWGTFVPQWYKGFFEMTRFGLGRFQFERSCFYADEYEKCGNVIRRGDAVINFHIPSSGPLTVEKRMDSYKRAYEFFGGKNGEPMAFVCDSWLLYEGHREFLPKNSNILGFMDDFDIIMSADKESFDDGWRVFGKCIDGPVDDLPEDTSIRRAFKQRLRQGKPTGYGYGVFFFNGEKILGK